MDANQGEIAQELFRAQTHLWSHLLNYMDSMSLKCAAQLGIFDTINNHGKPMALSELVAALRVHPSKENCVYRLMRVLVHSGFVALNETDNHEQEGYFLTPLCRLILQLEPNELSGNPFGVSEVLTYPWQFLSTWFQNNDVNAFQTAYGTTFYDYTAHNPSLGNRFNEIMAGDSQLIVNVLLRDCRAAFEELESLIDVGGGTGTTAKAIADAFPNIKCIVLDLPHVVADLQGTENLHFFGGDMFVAVPHANAVFLKWILHNYDDEDSVKILKRCKEAIPSKDEGGKVIIIDMVIENNSKVDEQARRTQLYFDMLMMVMFNGIQRTEKEWEKLFLTAGFSNYKITPKLGLRSLIEVYP